MYLFSFQIILLWQHYSFECDGLNYPMTHCRISVGIDSLVAITVADTKKERYVERVQKIFPEYSPDISSESVFMQNVALAHTSKMAMEWLKNRFPEKLISLKDVAYSPKLILN